MMLDLDAGHRDQICNCNWPLLPQEIWVSHLKQNLLVSGLSDIVKGPSQCQHICRWDCHGLPVEFEIDKKLSKFDIISFDQQLLLLVAIPHTNCA